MESKKNQKEQKLTIRKFGENRYPYILMPSFEPLHSKEEKRSKGSFPDTRSPLPAQCTFNVHEHVSFNLRSKWNGEFLSVDSRRSSRCSLPRSGVQNNEGDGFFVEGRTDRVSRSSLLSLWRVLHQSRREVRRRAP